MASSKGHVQQQLKNCSLVNHKSCSLWTLFYPERYLLHDNYMDSPVVEGQRPEQGCPWSINPRNAMHFLQLGSLWNAYKMLRETYMISPREYEPTDCKVNLSFPSYPASTELCQPEMSKKRETVKNHPPEPSRHGRIFLLLLRVI